MKGTGPSFHLKATSKGEGRKGMGKGKGKERGERMGKSGKEEEKR